jgi:hypothetical protein
MGRDRCGLCRLGGGDLAPARTLALTFVALAILVTAVPVASATTHRAAIVVTDTQGKTTARCVRFSERSINGLQLLQRAGYTAAIQQSSIGSAVCSVNGGGCSSTTNCFCHYPAFWGYWTRAPDATAWRFSDIGAQIRKVTDGSMDGWVWGKDGRPSPGQVSLDAICAASGPVNGTKHARGNYLAFAGFVAAFVVAGVLLARRRATRSR